MEKAYYEDQINYYKNAINKHNKFLYWLKKRVEEDERSIKQEVQEIPKFNREEYNKNKKGIFKILSEFLKCFIP